MAPACPPVGAINFGIASALPNRPAAVRWPLGWPHGEYLVLTLEADQADQASGTKKLKVDRYCRYVLRG
jgi:hypothetical protein